MGIYIGLKGKRFDLEKSPPTKRFAPGNPQIGKRFGRCRAEILNRLPGPGSAQSKKGERFDLEKSPLTKRFALGNPQTGKRFG